jgi:hypothetical protein
MPGVTRIAASEFRKETSEGYIPNGESRRTETPEVVVAQDVAGFSRIISAAGQRVTGRPWRAWPDEYRLAETGSQKP